MEKIFSIIEDKWHYILIGMLCFIVGLILFIGRLVSHDNTTETVSDEDIYSELLLKDLEEEEPEAETPQTLHEGNALDTALPVLEVIVDVKGAVHHPGVYTLTSDKRIIDAINLAGGLLEKAESKSVNFAQAVEDQMVIYIPEVGEAMDTPPTALVPHNPQVLSEEGATAKININTADQTALMTLKGIGHSKAENIMAYREENGLFRTIEEIKNVSGIGDATFDALKESIVITD